MKTKKRKARTWEAWAVKTGTGGFDHCLRYLRSDAFDDCHEHRVSGDNAAKVIRVRVTEIRRK